MLCVVSDIHDNLPNLQKALNWCVNHQVTALACCGDITNEETLDYLAKNFSKPIYLCGGNMELFDEVVLAAYNNIEYLGRAGGKFNWSGKNLGLVHEPQLIEPLLRKYPYLDLIFYGHTHRPWIETRHNLQLINPGTVAGTGHQPTFASYDSQTNQPQLHLLNELI